MDKVGRLLYEEKLNHKYLEQLEDLMEFWKTVDLFEAYSEKQSKEKLKQMSKMNLNSKKKESRRNNP